MAMPVKTEPDFGKTADNTLAPAAVYPDGTASIAPIPVGVEMQAQILLHQAGSPGLAKQAVDAAAERETMPDFREDMFGRQFGFASRETLLAASTPLIAADGTSWWTTAIEGNRWIVWNQEDMSASQSYATLQEARQSLFAANSPADRH